MYMAFIWFLLAVTFFALWLNKKPEETQEKSNYNQGYWDGYRALGSKISALLHHSHIDRDAIEREVQAGFGSDASAPEQHSSVDQSTAAEAIHTSQQLHQPTAAEKEAQSVKNLNILLVVASLLFVAAGAAFVAAAMPDIIKLTGIWIIAIIFYMLGIILHASSRFKAAGTAFIGTSLGIIPFAGVALYQLTDISGSVAWFITSLIGLFAYFYATIRLQSHAVSYLTLGFVVSLAASSSVAVSLPLMWSFVMMIGVALAGNLLAIMKPSWVPIVFKQSIELTGQLVTPLALVASLVLFDRLDIFAYQVVFGVATLHYVVVWLQSRRLVYESVIRGLGFITVALIAIDVFEFDPVPIGICLLVVSTVQQLYSVIRVRSNQLRLLSERVWVYAMQALQFLILPVLFIGNENAAVLTTLTLLVIGLLSLALTSRLRSIKEAWSGLGIALILPFIVGLWLIKPAVDMNIIALFFLLASGVIVFLWQLIATRSVAVQKYFKSTFIACTVITAILGLTLDDGWSTIIFVGLVVAGWLAAYRMKEPLLSIGGSVALFIATLFAWSFLDLTQAWQWLGSAWFVACILYAGYWLLGAKWQSKYQKGLVGMTWAILAIGVAAAFFGDDTKIAAALTIAAVAATVGIEGYRQKRRDLVEGAVYLASFGLQRTVGILAPDLNIVFYAHWWALTIGLIGLWRRQLRQRLIIAIGLVTASTGLYALSEGGFYQLLFLAEHLVLLIVGALRNKRWATWWGLVATVLAVLYFLKDVAFLAFGFLGLIVIGIVVWQLSRTKTS